MHGVRITLLQIPKCLSPKGIVISAHRLTTITKITSMTQLQFCLTPKKWPHSCYFTLRVRSRRDVCNSFYSAPSPYRGILHFHTVDSFCSLLQCILLDSRHRHIQWTVHPLHCYWSSVWSLDNHFL